MEKSDAGSREYQSIRECLETDTEELKGHKTKKYKPPQNLVAYTRNSMVYGCLTNLKSQSLQDFKKE
ncbi:MAG: hypothetical protein WBM22_14585 [Pseudomonas fluorescens]